MSTRALRLFSTILLGLAACWIGPESWEDWQAKNGTFDTGGVEGDVDTDVDADTDGDTDIDTVDDDGDGYSEAEGDCDDGNSAVNPAATDMVGDDNDQNCDGVDGTDSDGDGVTVHPGHCTPPQRPLG